MSMTRRIVPVEDRHENAKLKAIAGQLGQLSYREMQEFSKAVQTELLHSEHDLTMETVADALLKVSGDILMKVVA